MSSSSPMRDLSCETSYTDMMARIGGTDFILLFYPRVSTHSLWSAAKSWFSGRSSAGSR